jgi:16S rRNA (cytosine1402-N4)-methyltransferase
VVGIDRDKEAIERSRQRLWDYKDRVYLVQGNFRDLEKIVHDAGLEKVDGILADLGVSHLQLSDSQRGFSYTLSGPLSMQMRTGSGIDAGVLVNQYSEAELARIIREFGEERAYKKIARAIVTYRRRKKFDTTGELADVVRQAVGPKLVVKTLARVFQSLRICVNQELEDLTRFLPQAARCLKGGGRLAIISYHSLEDRMVKTFMRLQANPCTCPSDAPCVCDKKPGMKIITRLIKANDLERKKLPAARSARLRVAEKI